MKKILVLISLFMLISLVFAEDSAIGYLFSNPDSGVAEYNANIDNVPKSVKSLVGSEKILVYVIGETETRHITLTMKNAMIESYSFEEDEKATLVVYAKEEAVNRILNSNERIAELKLALKNKEITYQSRGIFKKIKFGFAKFALNFVK
ncbi:MAG TPA: hypothetical protein PK685_02155 [archaeon]|nr:hypothetical protein [archaeon]